MGMKNKKKFKTESFLNTVVFIVFNILIFSIMVSLLFIDKNIEYACKNSVKVSNLVLVSFGIVVIWIFYGLYKNYIRKYIYNLTARQCKIAMITAFILLFALQLIVTYNIYFPTAWDVGVLRNSSDILAQTGCKLDSNFQYQYYFLSYNNNVFLTVVFTIIKQIFNNISFLSGEVSVVLISVLCVNLAGVFTVCSVHKLFKNRGMVIAAFIIFSALVGLSPWIIIPYSDTFVLPFTTLTLLLYVSKDSSKHLWLRWFFIFLCAGIGYLIKPTCIIVLIAICIAEMWKFIFVSFKEKLLKLRMVVVAVIAMVLVQLMSMGASAYVGFKKDVDRAVPMTHFAMMGLNDTTFGTYFRDDVTYTSQFKTHDEKIEGNMKLIKERLKEYGPVGYIKQLDRKLLTNYNDGTFAWGIGGDFFKNVNEAPNSTIAPVIRSFYYNNGKNYSKLSTTQQAIWITILFFMIFLNYKKWKNHDMNMIVIIMTIIGITLFTLIFEARSRYLFLYSPFYIICGIEGIRCLAKIRRNKETNMDIKPK